MMNITQHVRATPSNTHRAVYFHALKNRKNGLRLDVGASPSGATESNRADAMRRRVRRVLNIVESVFTYVVCVK
jgi:hypothetical protein